MGRIHLVLALYALADHVCQIVVGLDVLSCVVEEVMAGGIHGYVKAIHCTQESLACLPPGIEQVRGWVDTPQQTQCIMRMQWNASATVVVTGADTIVSSAADQTK